MEEGNEGTKGRERERENGEEIVRALELGLR